MEQTGLMVVAGNSKLEHVRERSNTGFGHVREKSFGQLSGSLRRSKSTKSLRDRAKAKWRLFETGLDGTCEVLAGEDPSFGGSFGVAGVGLMSGIRERIKELRRRANTAPARLENEGYEGHGSLGI